MPFTKQHFAKTILLSGILTVATSGANKGHVPETRDYQDQKSPKLQMQEHFSAAMREADSLQSVQIVLTHHNDSLLALLQKNQTTF